MDTASVILLLISADFLASDYCYGVEMQKALERHRAGMAHVIPILLRPVDRCNAPFAHLSCLPSNEKPITSWSNQDKAFLDVAIGIRTLLENVYGLPSQQTYHTTSSKSHDHRTRMLKQVRTFWIDGVLEQSLHHMALITLGLYEHPDAVTNPWRLVMQEAERPAFSLPAGTRIMDVYDHSDGKLLILGKPGAGKTTLLLELARDLLVRAEQNRAYPVPIVFHLASWAKKETSFAHWLVNEFRDKYQLSRKVAQDWIDTDKVVLLLDGLDEVPKEAQPSCIQAINTYHQEHNLVSLVLCSRSSEYFAQATQVALQTAVEIQPLTEQQVNEYLLSAGSQIEALRLVLSANSTLRELSTSPLMLNIMLLTYHGKEMKDIAAEDTENRSLWMFGLTPHTHEVFKTYVQQMLHRRGSSEHFSSQQIVHWLIWVAENSSNDISHTLFRSPGCLLIQQMREEVFLSVPALVVLLACFGVATLNLLSSVTLLGFEMVPLGMMIRSWMRFIRSGGEAGQVYSARYYMKRISFFMVGIYLIAALIFPQRWLILLVGVVIAVVLVWPLAMLFNFLLRILLCLKGDIPWKDKDFLAYAAEHTLLYKMGNRYIYIHDLLRRYFQSLNATD